MSSEEGTIHIRSYRMCFKLERRIHSIDRWRLPMPYGIPLRGIGYFGASFLAVLILSAVPVVGYFLGLLNPWVRLVVVPMAGAWGLTRWEIDGRSAPAAGMAWARWRVGPSRVAAFRPAAAPGPVALGDVTLAPDERSASLRRGVVRGSGRIVLRYPVVTLRRRRTLLVSQRSGEPVWRGTQIQLKPRQRLVLR
jgi:TcpE family